jgi:PAS domain-containing protein
MIESNRAITMAAQGVEDVDQADFFGGSPVATFVINSDHVVTHFNKARAMTLGISGAQVIGGKGWAKFFTVVPGQ